MKEIKLKESKGITLTALVITIIILLILAGITLKSVTSENGLIKKTFYAKELTEIDNEMEIVDIATVKLRKANVTGVMSEKDLQEILDNQVKPDTVTVTEDVDTLIVRFNDSKREYEVDESGNVNGPIESIVDKYPGDITKGIDGKNLEGNEKNPYEINCIEDLVDFSNRVRDGENISYIVLKRNLSFTSTRSYTDYKTDNFGDINENGIVEELMTELTTGNGFEPIGKAYSTNNIVNISGFDGNFDGSGYKIKNLYINENKENGLGLFAYINEGGNVQNLRVTGSIHGIYAQGGIASCNEGHIKNCYSEVNITLDKVEEVESGGIVGRNKGQIESCYNLGSVTGETSNWIYNGGIAGINEGNITKCYNVARLISAKSTRSYAGGIVGYNVSTGNISKCYNLGKIEGIGSYAARVGGISRNFSKW